MQEYDEDDFLQLSGIQHYKFCKRQWALIHIENQWFENVRTAEGRLMHEKAHDIKYNEKRKNVIVSRAMPIHSRTMGVSGECDIVEFVRDDENGITLSNRIGRYKVYPVEYKRGAPKKGDEDISQLVAQAICLEEMFCCEVDIGYLYYGETRHRMEILITPELKQDVRETFIKMHNLYKKQYTPKAIQTKSCNACSIKDICLPNILEERSVKSYIDSFIKGAV